MFWSLPAGSCWTVDGVSGHAAPKLFPSAVSPGRPVRTKLMLVCFSQVVPAPKLGNHPPRWLFVKEIYGQKWNLTPLQPGFVPSSSGSETEAVVAGQGSLQQVGS